MLSQNFSRVSLSDWSEVLMVLGLSAIFGILTREAQIPLPTIDVQFRVFMLVLLVCVLAFQPIFKMKPKFPIWVSAALFSVLVFKG
jgi:hypothetical protein